MSGVRQAKSTSANASTTIALLEAQVLLQALALVLAPAQVKAPALVLADVRA